MPAKPRRLAKRKLERADHYVLRLYTCGSTARSARAIRNLKRICDTRLSGRYQLDVIDIYQEPRKASDDQIVAIPTLIKELPTPRRTFVGDLTDEGRLVAGLAIAPA